MKKRSLAFNYSILFILCQLFIGLFGISSVFADVNNFYFEDFTGDYYLSKDAEGVSRLKVVESVTAVFPEFPQNKGICRQIAFSNQDGKNVTLPSLSRENLTLTRNGAPEPIYSITKENGYYNVCTGTEEYVLGKQVYTFSYEFSKVVTDFGLYQELYWDTNGNGALQEFDKVTARVHFSEPEVYTGKSWCYVGGYGESGQERCTISTLDDGVEFSALNLAPGENLTFDTELTAGSFVVPESEKNYTFVWATGIIGALGFTAVGVFLGKFFKSREKEEYYKSIFVRPEYQPHKNYSLAEMSEMFIGKKKDIGVALLLEMVIKREIELRKTEKKRWEIIVKKEVRGEYEDLLMILNGGASFDVGDVISVKKHKPSQNLVSLKVAMNSQILGDLRRDELVEKKYSIGESERNRTGVIANALIIAAFMTLFFGIMIMAFLEGDGLAGVGYGVDLVFKEYAFYAIAAILFVTIFLCILINGKAKKYQNYTKKGLEAARYMDGLKLYIKMAETERIKFLQSVDGADTSATGIVKLYEKLLPYAAVFGLEESWMNEMRQYCEVHDIVEPDYFVNGMAASEISRGLRGTAAIATVSSTMSSSGGGSSSGSSGGGGGGFSGGGGGGGGFSGR